ncbi:MAG: hypothetical protein ABMB14_19260 [Myxococcota bacterium]
MPARLVGAALLVGTVGLLGGCGAGACLDLPATCTPEYDPAFAEVYANTLAPTCALSGCHAGTGTGGLGLGTTIDEAYAGLDALVVPGDAACSPLIDHLEPDGLGDMPPGRVLTEAERCAIRSWIDAGAEGP